MLGIEHFAWRSWTQSQIFSGFLGEERLSQVTVSVQFCHSTIVLDISILFLNYTMAPFLKWEQLNVHVIEPVYNYQNTLCTASSSYSKKYIWMSSHYLVPKYHTASKRNYIFYGAGREVCTTDPDIFWFNHMLRVFIGMVKDLISQNVHNTVNM